MVLTIIFCILIVFQYLAFSSVAEPYINESSVYLSLTRSFWFMLPLVIETLWGLSFLRDSCNYSIIQLISVSLELPSNGISENKLIVAIHYQHFSQNILVALLEVHS